MDSLTVADSSLVSPYVLARRPVGARAVTHCYYLNIANGSELAGKARFCGDAAFGDVPARKLMAFGQKKVDISRRLGDKANMFAKTHRNAGLASRGRKAPGRLLDANVSLLLVLVLIILPMSGASVFA